MAGCGGVCYEVDAEAGRVDERLAYVGSGKGSYQQVSSMEMVGAGKGDFEKERVVVAQGYRLRAGLIAGLGLLFLLLVGLAVFLLGRAQPAADDVIVPIAEPQQVHKVDRYYYHVKNVKVDHTVPVPIPSAPAKVITHKVVVHTHAFNCDGGTMSWQSTWSTQQQHYCCYLRGIGCHTKVVYRPHYHTITKTKQVSVPMPVPVPPPPAQVITHVQNMPIHDAPQVIKVPTPGAPHVVPKYIHQKHFVPVPEPSPPQYHSVPVPVKVTDPGKVIKVPSPMPQQTIVKNKVIYKTKHLKVQHVYDCAAGYSNWNSGWSSAKKSWCCTHEQRGCPGSHSGHLTKTVVTHVSTHEGPTYYHHSHSYTGGFAGSHAASLAGETVGATSMGESSMGASLMGESVGGSYGAGDAHVMGEGYDMPETMETGRRLQMFDAESPIMGEAYAGGVDASAGFVHGGMVAGEHGLVSSGVVTSGADGGLVSGEGMITGDEGADLGYVAGASHVVTGASHIVSQPEEASVVRPPVYTQTHYVSAPAVHYTVPAAVPAPVPALVPAPVPAPHTKTLVRTHYHTVYRKVPVNHYVHVQSPTPAPIVHTVKVVTPPKTYNCDGVGGSPDPSWSVKHRRWCCYKYNTFCEKEVVDKNVYHTVVKTQPVRVPVPEPMPTNPPIVKTIHHSYHVPSPPQYVHVPEPGPTVVKPVVVPESVPVPVPQPPQVINVKKPYAVHVPGPNHYVHVPVPTPPHVVTKYHTQWNTVVDHAHSSYDCDIGSSDWHSLWSHAKQRWCCHSRMIGCPGSSTVTHVVHHYGDYGDSTGHPLVHHYGDFDADSAGFGSDASYGHSMIHSGYGGASFSGSTDLGTTAPSSLQATPYDVEK